ncbi:MAG: hypothetical protein K2K37_02235 [Muribaculaceae bacterium]|nr:hypothetical protein [Muribaculaceae bacterium]
MDLREKGYIFALQLGEHAHHFRPTIGQTYPDGEMSVSQKKTKKQAKAEAGNELKDIYLNFGYEGGALL